MGPLGSESLDNWDYLSPTRREARDGGGSAAASSSDQTSAAPLAQQHHFVTFVLARDGASPRRGSEVSAAKAERTAASAPLLF